MIALNAFVASFAIGVGGTGWLILYERQAAGDRRAGMTSGQDPDAAAA